MIKDTNECGSKKLPQAKLPPNKRRILRPPPHPEIYSHNGIIWHKPSPEEKAIRVIDDFKDITIYSSIEDDSVTYKLTIDYCGGEKTISVPRANCTVKGLTNYTAMGADFQLEYKNAHIIKHLINTERRKGTFKSYNGLGWIEYDGKLIYRWKQAIVDGKISDEYMYVGTHKVGKKGKYADYLEFLKREVSSNICLELALVMSLASILIGLVGRDMGIESLIAEFVSGSSQGKTSAFYLMNSVYAYPGLGNNTIMRLFNTTINALIDSLSNNFGVIFTIDEGSMISTLPEKERQMIIYKLSSGRDKARLTKDITQRETKEWGTLIALNSEASQSNSTQNAGAQVRIISLQGYTYTKDAGNADRIKKFTQKNYGHLAPRFAKLIQQFSKDEIIELVEKNQSIITKKLNEVRKNRMNSRIAGKLAILETTAELIKCGLEIDIDTLAIENLLLDNEIQRTENISLADKAYSIILDEFSGNKSCFEVLKNGRRDRNVPILRECWGSYNVRGNAITEVIFRYEKLGELLKKHKFMDCNIILRALCDEGLSKGQDSRPYCYRTVQGIPKVKAVALQIKSDTYEMGGYYENEKRDISRNRAASQDKTAEEEPSDTFLDEMD